MFKRNTACEFSAEPYLRRVRSPQRFTLRRGLHPESSSFVLLYSLELSDTHVYEPYTRALLGTLTPSPQPYTQILDPKPQESMTFICTVASSIASLLEAVSFDRPLLTGRSIGNGPFRTAGFPQINGRGLGAWDASPGVRVGVSACAATKWVADTSVRWV